MVNNKTGNDQQSVMNSAIKAYPWHALAIEHIQRQHAENRLPHATLFRRRRGYFDEILGWQIARLILCDTGQCAEDYAGNDTADCRHCRLVAERTHPNVLLLDVHNDKVGIAQVRELEQQMWQTSVFDKPKVAYISGMDLLSIAAQNALLKTLEEPPKQTFFVLSVDNISRVLPTIMSRVQRLHHGRFETHALLHWLQSQLSTAMTEAEIGKVAKLADFAPRRALNLLTSPEALAELSEEKARFADFMRGQLSASALVSSMDKDNSARQLTRFCHYTENMIRFLFEKSVQKTDNAKQMQPTNSDSSAQYALWQGVSLRGFYRLLDTLTELRRLADTNVNMTMQLTTNLTKWQHDRTN